MKQRSTTHPTVSKQFAAKSCLVAVAVLISATSIIESGSIALARDYDAEIKANEQKAAKYNATAGELDQMASTLEAELSKLRSQAAAIQNQITASENERTQLLADIAANEKKIKENQDALGIIIADLLSLTYI